MSAVLIIHCSDNLHNSILPYQYHIVVLLLISFKHQISRTFSPNIRTSCYNFFIASPSSPIKNPTTPTIPNKILYINSSFHSGHKPFLYFQYSISPVPFLVLCLRYSKKINVFLQPDKKRTVYASHIHCSKPYSLCFISGILVQTEYNFSNFPFNSFFSLFSQVRKTHNFKVSSNPHAS